MRSAAIRRDESQSQAGESEDANMGDPLEARVARIESDVEHIKVVTTDLHVELRRTNDRIDALDKKFDAKIDALDKKFDAKFGSLEAKLDGLKDKLHSVTVRAMFLCLTLSGGLLTVLAKGFKWI